MVKALDTPDSSGELESNSEEEGAISNAEEVLDFEEDEEPKDSSDGEVISDEDEKNDGEVVSEGEEVKEDGEFKGRDSDSVEEGEVTDEEVISEIDRKDNKPVCRFFSKGTCTWGNNCRFLHPGVTDKGLYSMFETVPPPPPHSMKPALLGPGPATAPDSMMGPPVHESAWERGLRHAKEIIRASAKRKQTDVDFEEKKINLSLAEDEEVDDKENNHYVRKPDLEEKKRLIDDDFPIDEQEIISARAEFSRNKVDPEFVRERVHRVKRHEAGVSGRSPPPRRMVRESELRKMEMDMMIEGDERKRPQPTDPYGRNIPRHLSRTHKPHKRSRSRSSSGSESSSSSSSSSASRRRSRRTRYYSRDSEDSRVSKRKHKRSESSGTDTSGSRRVRRRRNTVSSSSTSRSRSKSGGRRRSSSRSSSGSRKSERRVVRKAPPREGGQGGQGGVRQLRIAPPLPHFEGENQTQHYDRNSRWAPPGGPYRRAPPPRAPRYFQGQRDEARPIGLVRERDLIQQPNPPTPPQPQEPQSPPKDKTPIPSPSGSITGSPRRTKTRYKREYSSERMSRSRSRSRSYSNSRSGSSEPKRRSGSRSSTSFSGSRSRSRSNTPGVARGAPQAPNPPLRKAPPPPDSPTPPPRSPSPPSQKPKQNQIKLTLKHNTVRVANKHVIQRLGGLNDEEEERGVVHDERDNEEIASTPMSPSSPQDDQTPSTRREELLKQLKAVEEAIAKKRSKLDTK